MTKQEAIEGLEMYYRMCCFEPKYGWSKYEFRLKSYTRTLVPIVIDMIEKSPMSDPIAIIRTFKMQLDDLICESDHSKTWDFCSYAMKICDELIDWLK